MLMVCFGWHCTYLDETFQKDGIHNKDENNLYWWIWVETYGFEEKSEEDINKEKESKRKRRAKRRENIICFFSFPIQTLNFSFNFCIFYYRFVVLFVQSILHLFYQHWEIKNYSMFILWLKDSLVKVAKCCVFIGCVK